MTKQIEILAYSDKWAVMMLEESADPVLRALALAWRHAEHMPQNSQQYRAGVLHPALTQRMLELGLINYPAQDNQ